MALGKEKEDVVTSRWLVDGYLNETCDSPGLIRLKLQTPANNLLGRSCYNQIKGHSF